MEEVKQTPQDIKDTDFVEEKIVRPSWDEYFANLVDPIGSRGTCDRAKSGALIVSKHNTILATGYIGAPPGQPHCDEVGHLMRTVVYEDGHSQQHCVRTLHAEENAMLQCAKDGIRLDGAIIYCKMVPCWNCAMRIIRVGITKVVAKKRYHADAQSVEMLKNSGIELVVLDDSIEKYANQ